MQGRLGGADLRALDRQSVLSGSGSDGGIFDSYCPDMIVVITRDRSKLASWLGRLNDGLPADRVEHVAVFQKWNKMRLV